MAVARKKAKSTIQPTLRFTVAAEGLNLRETPDSKGRVKTVLSKGARVERIGVSGDGYWFEVRRGRTTGWVAQKYLQALPATTVRSSFPWFAIARGELGVQEVPGSGANPRIVEYLRSTTLGGSAASLDETPWCSAFANWCVERAEYAGTDSAWARSWLDWGVETDSPRAGCIVVLERGVTSGHVGFFVSKTATSIVLLAGNQSNKVCEAEYPLSRLLGYRIPA